MFNLTTHRMLTALLAILVSVSVTALSEVAQSPLRATGPLCSVPGTYPTIQQAVNDSSCGTINVAAGLYTENVSINRAVTINGAGEVGTTLDGGGTGAVVSVFGGMVSISGLTIMNGKSKAGGGIWNFGTLTLTQTTVVSNTALSNPAGGDGGGIFNGGTLLMTQSIVTGNHADNRGAGIYQQMGSMTLVNSTVSDNRATGGAVPSGGGIYADGGPLTLVNSTVSGNSTAGGTFAVGGGIESLVAAVTLTRSTVSGNSASGNGGGINVGISSTLSLANSTISENVASGYGAGIKVDFRASANLFNATVAFNAVGMSSSGGGVYNAGTLSLTNTILDANVRPLSSPPYVTGDDCQGSTLTSLGYILISSPISCTINGSAMGNLYVSAKLGPLRSNGGPTQTHALLAGSPAIDAGNPGGCRGSNGVILSTDQRGFPRPAFGGTSLRCDIGAYELYRFGLALPLITR